MINSLISGYSTVREPKKLFEIMASNHLSHPPLLCLKPSVPHVSFHKLLVIPYNRGP